MTTISNYINTPQNDKNTLLETIQSAKQLNKKLNAVVRFFDLPTKQNKKESDYYGIPIIIKDNILLKGNIASCGSKMLEDFVAPYTATCVENLQKQGIIPIGSANMDEFAMGGSNETSAFGYCTNPYGEKRIPGGSSGGSAVAVASGMVPIALGTDTGGSVRQPASMCGIVGFKPTYGAISRYGVVAMASSLDQIGIFSNTVEDSQLLFSIIASHDKKDATSSSLAEEVKQISSPKISCAKFFVPQESFGEGLDPRVKEIFNKKIDQLRSLGHIVDIKPFPILKACLAIYYTLMPSEVSTNLSRFDGIRFGVQANTHDFKSLDSYYSKIRANTFGDEVKRRILLGTYLLSSSHYESYYLKAQQAQKTLKTNFSTLFETYDAILTPTSPEIAWKIGEKNGDPLKQYLADLYTVPANLAGLPAISIPMGSVLEKKENLPIGIQLMGKQWDDQKILALAKIIEKLG